MKISIDKKAFMKSLASALEGTAIDFEEALQSKLTLEHGKFHGDLQSNIKVTVEDDNTLLLSMPIQGKYLEWGTPPHFPPPEALEDWVKLKWHSKDKVSDSWILAKHIAKHGTRPFPFIRPTMNEELNGFLLDNLKSAFK